MTLTTELDSFAAAVEAAEAQIEEGSSVESPDLHPEEGTEAEAAPDQADPLAEDEQAEVEGPPEAGSSEDSDELFADIEVEEPEAEETPEPEADLHTLPGIDEPVSTQELRDGYLRQADYTKKTQELAAERKTLEQAARFWEVFTKDPHAVAAQLAVTAGLIEEGAQPVKVVDLPFRSEEDVQAEIDRKVAEELENHPLIQEARVAAGKQWIADEFARIESTYEVKLGPESQRKVLLKAQKEGLENLEVAYKLLLLEKQEKARQRQDLQKGAPARPTSSGTPAETPEEIVVESIQDAVKLAEMQIASRRR